MLDFYLSEKRVELVTIHRAHAPDQAERVAIPDQKAKRSLVLLTSKVVCPEIQTSSRGHCRGEIRLAYQQ